MCESRLHESAFRFAQHQPPKSNPTDRAAHSYSCAPPKSLPSADCTCATSLIIALDPSPPKSNPSAALFRAHPSPHSMIVHSDHSSNELSV
eukprot:1723130-Amphidinium_carterae.1